MNPQTVFQNPIERLYATYTYDGMVKGDQWTALWYREGELLKYETSPWEGGTGGSGQYELALPADEWLPGKYQLIFFVGTEWKKLGEFRITGDPSTATPSPTLTPTITSTATSTATRTLRPTATQVR